MSKKNTGGDGFDNSLEFKKKGEAVDILCGRKYIRTFSKKQHGAKFETLAGEFVAGRKDGMVYQIVDSSDVPVVEVIYREATENSKGEKIFVDRTRIFKDKYTAHYFNNEVHGTILIPE